MNQRTVLVVAALAIAAGAWLDPLYLPLITLGPVLSGLAAGAGGIPPRLVALTWFGAGVLVLLADLAINQEDAAFHAVVAVITAAVGAAFAARGRRVRGAPAAISRG